MLFECLGLLGICRVLVVLQQFSLLLSIIICCCCVFDYHSILVLFLSLFVGFAFVLLSLSMTMLSSLFPSSLYLDVLHLSRESFGNKLSTSARQLYGLCKLYHLQTPLVGFHRVCCCCSNANIVQEILNYFHKFKSRVS